MGKMFGGLTQTENLEESQDRLGGGFEAVPSDLYIGEIKLAYAGKSPKGAQNVTLHVDIGGKELRETIYLTTKAGDNFYTDKDDATKKHPLPGFTTVDDICLLTTGHSLIDQDTEEKVVKLYDFQERKELNKPVECLTALHGQQIALGVLRIDQDKNKKNDQTGEYEPTGETMTINEIDKVFHAETRRTVNEYKQEVESAEFAEAWVKKNQGKNRNKIKGGGAGGAGSTGVGRPGAGNSPAPKKSLFGK